MGLVSNVSARLQRRSECQWQSLPEARRDGVPQGRAAIIKNRLIKGTRRVFGWELAVNRSQKFTAAPGCIFKLKAPFKMGHHHFRDDFLATNRVQIQRHARL